MKRSTRRLLSARLRRLLGLELLLGRGGGRLLAELHVGVRDVLGLVEDDERRGAARQQQQGDGDAGRDQPPAPLALRRGHAALGYRRAIRILERLRDAPALRAVAGEPGVWTSAARCATRCWARAARARPGGGRRLAVARRVAARIGGELVVHERFGTATVRAGALVLDLASARRERYPAPGALPRWSSGRRSRRTSPGATSRSTRSRWPWPTEPWPRSHMPRRTSGRVCCVLHDASFADDPTRPLRLARYAARLGFALSPTRPRSRRRRARRRQRRAPRGQLRCSSTSRSPPRWQALARYAPALLPGLDPDPDRSRPCSRPRRPTRGATCSRSPRPGVPTTSGRWRSGSRPPTGSSAPARAAAVRAALDAAAAPSAVRPSCGASPSRSPSSRAASRPGDGSPSGGTRGPVSGVDLLAAGLRGPEIGAGLDAATDALLDGRAPDREAQLAAALAHAAPPPPPRG